MKNRSLLQKYFGTKNTYYQIAILAALFFSAITVYYVAFPSKKKVVALEEGLAQPIYSPVLDAAKKTAAKIRSATGLEDDKPVQKTYMQKAGEILGDYKGTLGKVGLGIGAAAAVYYLYKNPHILPGVQKTDVDSESREDFQQITDLNTKKGTGNPKAARTDKTQVRSSLLNQNAQENAQNIQLA